MNNTEYHPFAKFLHWSVVFLVVVEFLSAWFSPEHRDTVTSDILMSVHISIGILLFIAISLLLFMRFFRPTFKPMTNTQEKAAVLMQYLLYFMIIALTFSGWVAASIRGIEVGFANLFSLPALLERGSSIGFSIAETHEFFSTILLILIVGHVAAALYHHHILKDSTLIRILPKR
ncbi:MAG: cytochrome b/b6 domain-containing protein [Minisyncoccia bacterium]